MKIAWIVISNDNKQDNDELKPFILQDSIPSMFNLKSLANKVQWPNSEIDKDHQSFEDSCIQEMKMNTGDRYKKHSRIYADEKYK